MEFLVFDLSSYRYLHKFILEQSVQAVMPSTDAGQFQAADGLRDRFCIRTKVYVKAKPIKFEIVLKGRIGLDKRGKKPVF